TPRIRETAFANPVEWRRADPDRNPQFRKPSHVTYFDAHNHLHDARLAPHRESFLPELAQLSIGKAVANGTREEDWDAVQAMSAGHSWIIPSYGLHPWYAPSRAGAWLKQVRARLESDPRAAIGEIGLDRWVKGYDLDLQRSVFLDQLRL